MASGTKAASSGSTHLRSHAAACPEDLERRQFGAFPAAGVLSVVRNDGLKHRTPSASFLLIACTGCIRHLEVGRRQPEFVWNWDEQLAVKNQTGWRKYAPVLRAYLIILPLRCSASCLPAYRFHFLNLAAKGAYHKQRRRWVRKSEQCRSKVPSSWPWSVCLTSPGACAFGRAQSHDQARGSYAMAAVKRQQPAP